MDFDVDIRSVLQKIHVPTLVMHWLRDVVPAEGSRYVADRIPGARFVELEGDGHSPFDGDTDRVIHELEHFVSTIQSEEAAFDRVLTTVLFTDIVGATQMAAELGDRGWRQIAERHHTIVRAMLARYRGNEVDTAGDGFFATFDGPARAVRCAEAIIDAMTPISVEVRAVIHTGEVEKINDKVGGIAVSIGARVGALAGPREVFVSSTVKDLNVRNPIRDPHEVDGTFAEHQSASGAWRTSWSDQGYPHASTRANRRNLAINAVRSTGIQGRGRAA